MTASPFQQALGADFSALPDALQQFHRNDARRVFQGRANVEHGAGALPAIAAKLGGFPAPGTDIPLTIFVFQEGPTERWKREFGTHHTCSNLRYDQTTDTIIERFGLVTCALSLSLTNLILELSVTHTSLLGIGLPSMFSPRSESKEWQDEQGRFCFDIAAYLGQERLLIRYSGWLEPSARTAS